MDCRKLFPWGLRRYLKRIADVPDMWNTLYRLKEQNIASKTILDVGAFCGDWTRNCLKVFPDSNYFLFEAQEGMADSLKMMETDQIVIENIFLGENDGTYVDFYEAGTSSSALRFGSHTSIKKNTISLDNYCREKSIKSIDILKLDVQGYELNILKGAKTILNNVNLIITEVSFIDVYVDCPLVNEVIQYLDSYQFQLFDIVDFRRREIDNHLWQCDMFFIKKDSFLLKEKRKDKKQNRPK
jgi:FkbM family methyltransferase